MVALWSATTGNEGSAAGSVALHSDRPSWKANAVGLGGIVSLSERVDQLLGEVAHGAGEQNLGITQVEQAVQELDRATQQNVAMVQRTVAAVEDLREDAATLAGAVARFHLPPMRDMAITQAEN